MTRKQILLRVIPAFILLFLVIFFLKKGMYNNHVNFYKNNINSVLISIEKSKQTRGIKVYYGEEDNYFYLHNYKGIPLKKGDSINKIQQNITVFRKEIASGEYNFIGKGFPIKPESSFLSYFFSF